MKTTSTRPNPLTAMATAFSYFSTLPVPQAGNHGAPAAGSLLVLPLVGATIGALAGLLGWAASLWLPQPFPTLVAFAALLLGSGAIHFDGFLDSCDALFSALPPAERRAIFKDPRRGSFAIAGAAIIVPFWISAISALPANHWWMSLSFAGAVGRWGAILNGARIPHAGHGASSGLRVPARWIKLVFWGILLGVAAVAITKSALGLVMLVAGLGLLMGEWARMRLGGVLVGDVYGAISVVLEVVTLLGLLVLPTLLR